MNDPTKNPPSKCFKDFYLKKSEELEKDVEQKVLLSHFGVLSQQLILKLSDQFRSVLASKGLDSSVRNKIFSIMLESLQSFKIHGSIEKLTGKQLCFLIITETNQQILIYLTNIIKIEESDYVKPYLESINEMNSQQLQVQWQKSLERSLITYGGAGLGFINARIKSNNAIQHDFQAINEEQITMNLKIFVDKV